MWLTKRASRAFLYTASILHCCSQLELRVRVSVPVYSPASINYVNITLFILNGKFDDIIN